MICYLRTHILTVQICCCCRCLFVCFVFCIFLLQFDWKEYWTVFFFTLFLEFPFFLLCQLNINWPPFNNKWSCQLPNNICNIHFLGNLFLKLVKFWKLHACALCPVLITITIAYCYWQLKNHHIFHQLINSLVKLFYFRFGSFYLHSTHA